MRRNNNRPSYYPKHRRKQVRINKRRFTFFILSCLLILFGFFFSIKSLLTDNVSVTIGLTDDLNAVEGESLYKLSFTWEALDSEKYKEIQITVNDQTYVLDSGLTHFEVDLTEPNEDYEVSFKAKKKGLVFSKTTNTVVQTFADNEVLEQSVSNLKLENNILSFEHEIQMNPNMEFNPKSVTYEAVDLMQQVISLGSAKVLSKDQDAVTLSVSIPMDEFEDSSTVSLTMGMPVNQINLVTPVKDMNLRISSVSTKPFEVTFEQQNLILINKNIEHYNYQAHTFYAESLHLTLASGEDFSNYQLVNTAGRVIVDAPYSPLGNQGIDLSSLKEGKYFIKLDDLPVYVSDFVSETWYTVMRNDQANKVTLQSESGQLVLIVEVVNELPEGVYDILIDPGHGGLDSGTATGTLIEAEEALNVSLYIAQRLEDHGLKVKVTRTDESDPAGPGNFDYTLSPYLEDGRVDQVYRYQTNYAISNHLNSFDKSLDGFEVYSSICTDDRWSSMIATYLEAAGQTARDALTSEFRVSNGSYKKYYISSDDSKEYKDYLYMIRETGGPISSAEAIVENNDSYTTLPNYGAETILIEYAYIDNATEAQEWINNWRLWGEAVVQATVEYLGITYQK